MFDVVNGLPLHPLVVHATVVMVPLAVLGLVVVALVPRWRPRWSGAVAVASLIALVLCPLATQSGEALEARVGNPGEHAELGDQLVFFVLPVAVLAVALWWLTRRETRGAEPLARGLAVGLVVLSVVSSVAAGVQVVRVGESGARAVWGGVAASSPAGGGGDQDGDDD